MEWCDCSYVSLVHDGPLAIVGKDVDEIFDMNVLDQLELGGEHSSANIDVVPPVPHTAHDLDTKMARIWRCRALSNRGYSMGSYR